MIMMYVYCLTCVSYLDLGIRVLGLLQVGFVCVIKFGDFDFFFAAKDGGSETRLPLHDYQTPEISNNRARQG